MPWKFFGGLCFLLAAFVATYLLTNWFVSIGFPNSSAVALAIALLVSVGTLLSGLYAWAKVSYAGWSGFTRVPDTHQMQMVSHDAYEGRKSAKRLAILQQSLMVAAALDGIELACIALLAALYHSIPLSTVLYCVGGVLVIGIGFFVYQLVRWHAAGIYGPGSLKNTGAMMMVSVVEVVEHRNTARKLVVVRRLLASAVVLALVLLPEFLFLVKW